MSALGQEDAAPRVDPVTGGDVHGLPPGLTSRTDSGFGAQLTRLGSESLVYGLSAIVGRLISYLLQPYYALHFDPAQSGVQSVVYSYIPILSVALYLGMDVAFVRNAVTGGGATVTERQRAFTMSFGVVALVGGLLTVVPAPRRA
jgi:O-antigen/teichoic acid export membrane protein